MHPGRGDGASDERRTDAARSVRSQHGQPIALPEPGRLVEYEQANTPGGDTVAVSEQPDHGRVLVAFVDISAGEYGLLFDKHAVTDLLVFVQILAVMRWAADDPRSV
jgi:hypothetical protein